MTTKKTAAERQDALTDPPPAMPVEGEAPATEAESEQIKVDRTDFDSSLVQRLRSRHMPTGKKALEAGEIIKRRKVTFEMDGVECEPDMFINESGEYIVFKITMRSLDSAGEINALRGCKDIAMAPMMLAKAGLFEINGTALDENNREFFWEALGMGGRQICMLAFQSLGAASENALGKYLSSRFESS